MYCSVVSVLALIYYLRSAWTNPGYLIGSVADEARRAGAYDPKMYAVDGDNVDGEDNMTIDISAAGQYNDYSQDDADLSVIDKNFDDISPTGSNSHHTKNPSFLTKDFSISRHERRKSAMGLDGGDT